MTEANVTDTSEAQHITHTRPFQHGETGEAQAALPLAPDFALPLNTVRRRIAVIASQGAGKTYLSMVLVERMAEQGLPVIIIDPLGVYWGLRLMANGVDQGLQILIMGGRKGDLPLDPAAGSVIADILVELRRPVILDLSLFGTIREQCRFVADLLTGLRRYEKPRLHLVIDEVDIFAPQIAKSAEAQASADAMDTFVRRDRVKGLGGTFLTQRPARVAKDVLTQVDALVALRMGGPQDIRAIDEWFKNHAQAGQREEFLSTIAKLPTGTAWVWSPSWLETFRQVRVQGRKTYDSSATPEMEDDESSPASLAVIDVTALGERIQSLAVQAQESDPRVLKDRIARLEAALRRERGQGERDAEGSPFPAGEAEEEIERLRAENAALREALGAREKGEGAESSRGSLQTLAVETAHVERLHLGDAHALMGQKSDERVQGLLAQLAELRIDRQVLFGTLEFLRVQNDLAGGEGGRVPAQSHRLVPLEQLRPLVQQASLEVQRLVTPLLDRARHLRLSAPPSPAPQLGHLGRSDLAPLPPLVSSEQDFFTQLLRRVNTRLSNRERAMLRYLVEHEGEQVLTRSMAEWLDISPSTLNKSNLTNLLALPFVERLDWGGYRYKATPTAFFRKKFTASRLPDAGLATLVVHIVAAAKQAPPRQD